MRSLTWRTYFLVGALTIFHALDALHGPRQTSFSTLCYCLVLGVCVGVAIAQWEAYHLDWKDRNEPDDNDEDS